jgi:hypothetical protein
MLRNVIRLGFGDEANIMGKASTYLSISIPNSSRNNETMWYVSRGVSRILLIPEQEA